MNATQTEKLVETGKMQKNAFYYQKVTNLIPVEKGSMDI